MASAGLIQSFNDIEDGIHAPNMGVRTIECAGMFLDGSRFKDAWKVLVCDTNAGIGLPIFEQNVVPGIIFLDEIVL